MLNPAPARRNVEGVSGVRPSRFRDDAVCFNLIALRSLRLALPQSLPPPAPQSTGPRAENNMYPDARNNRATGKAEAQSQTARPAPNPAATPATGPKKPEQSLWWPRKYSEGRAAHLSDTRDRNSSSRSTDRQSAAPSSTRTTPDATAHSLSPAAACDP